MGSLWTIPLAPWAQGIVIPHDGDNQLLFRYHPHHQLLMIYDHSGQVIDSFKLLHQPTNITRVVISEINLFYYYLFEGLIYRIWRTQIQSSQYQLIEGWVGIEQLISCKDKIYLRTSDRLVQCDNQLKILTQYTLPEKIETIIGWGPDYMIFGHSERMVIADLNLVSETHYHLSDESKLNPTTTIIRQLATPEFRMTALGNGTVIKHELKTNHRTILYENLVISELVIDSGKGQIFTTTQMIN